MPRKVAAGIETVTAFVVALVAKMLVLENAAKGTTYGFLHRTFKHITLNTSFDNLLAKEVAKGTFKAHKKAIVAAAREVQRASNAAKAARGNRSVDWSPESDIGMVHGIVKLAVDSGKIIQKWGKGRSNGYVLAVARPMSQRPATTDSTPSLSASDVLSMKVPTGKAAKVSRKARS